MILRSKVNWLDQSRWMIIPQIEHARLAGDLFRNWRSAMSPDECPYSLVLSTIYRHDNGWRDWDRRPDVDPKTGRPYAFTEMPIDIANEIWRDSIDAVVPLGPLACYLVASHFVQMREQSAREGDSQAAAFVEYYEPQCARWLDHWLTLDPRANSVTKAHTSLDYLQFFDRLSLWLCCEDDPDPTQMMSPQGVPLRLLPDVSNEIFIAPWPFNVGSLSLSVVGFEVPAAHYADRDALANAAANRSTIHWQLRPKT